MSTSFLSALVATVLITAQGAFAFAPTDLVGKWTGSRTESRGEDMKLSAAFKGKLIPGGAVRFVETPPLGSSHDIQVIFLFQKDGKFTRTTFDNGMLIVSYRGTWRQKGEGMKILAQQRNGQTLRGTFTQTKSGFLFSSREQRDPGLTRVTLVGKRTK